MAKYNRQTVINKAKFSKDIMCSLIFDDSFKPIYCRSCARCPFFNDFISTTDINRAKAYTEAWDSIYVFRCGAYFDGENIKPTSYCLIDDIVF